jgi:hypothetical protein
MIAIAITILLFLGQMNLLTEKHWTLSNTMRPWRFIGGLTRMCLKLGTVIFITGPQDYARRCVPHYRAHRGYLITFWTMIKRPYRPHGFTLLETIQRFCGSTSRLFDESKARSHSVPQQQHFGSGQQLIASN